MSSKYPTKGCGSKECESCASLQGEGPWCGRCGADQDGTYNEFHREATENGWADICYECLVCMGWRTCGYVVPAGPWEGLDHIDDEGYMSWDIIETDMYGYEYKIANIREWDVANSMVQQHNGEIS